MTRQISSVRVLEIAARHIDLPDVQALAAHALHMEGAVLEWRDQDGPQTSQPQPQPMPPALLAASKRLHTVLTDEPEYTEADDMATAAADVIERLRTAVDEYSTTAHEMATEEYHRLHVQYENLRGELDRALAEVASLKAAIQMRDSRDQRLFSLLGVENWTDAGQRLNAIINDRIDSAPITYIGPAGADNSFAVEYIPMKWTALTAGDEVMLEDRRCVITGGETVAHDGRYHCVILRPLDGEIGAAVNYKTITRAAREAA